MGIKFISKIIKYISIFSGIFFATATALADTAIIPNTFIAGEPVDAQDLNDNFTAVKAAIDGNASKLPVLKDSNGIIKGTIITMHYSSITLMSEKSYIYQIESNAGELNAQYLLYASTDCTGTAYTRRIQTVQTDGTNYLYVPKGSSPLLIETNSILVHSGDCAAQSPSYSKCIKHLLTIQPRQELRMLH